MRQGWISHDAGMDPEALFDQRALDVQGIMTVTGQRD